MKNVTVMGFDFGKYSGSDRTDEQTQQSIRAAVRQMFDWYESGMLRPVTSFRFPLRDFATAMDKVLARESMGKVVLEMPLAQSAQA